MSPAGTRKATSPAGTTAPDSLLRVEAAPTTVAHMGENLTVVLVVLVLFVFFRWLGNRRKSSARDSDGHEGLGEDATGDDGDGGGGDGD